MDLYFSTLENGIRMVHYPVSGIVSHCALITGAGSRNETDEEHGLAHFIEHMLFKGTKRRKAWHILSRLDDAGGELNAFTTKEETVVHASVLKEHYKRAVELLGDIACNASFPDKEIEKEKEVVIEEINSYLDSPSELIFDDFDELVFNGSPLGRSILGSYGPVRSFTTEKIREFIAANYDTTRMVFCSVGPVSAREAERLFVRYFGPMPANRCAPRNTNAPDYRAQTMVNKKGTNQTHCITGNIAYSLHDSRRIVMFLLNNVLGGHGLNSRLSMSLREKKGYVYTVESGYSPYSDTGLFSVYFGTDGRNAERSFSIVRRELDRLMRNRLGPVQMVKARNQIIGYLARSYENHEHLMLSMGKSLLVFGKIEKIEDICRKIEAITAGQIMDVANEVFAPEMMSSLMYVH